MSTIVVAILVFGFSTLSAAGGRSISFRRVNKERKTLLQLDNLVVISSTVGTKLAVCNTGRSWECTASVLVLYHHAMLAAIRLVRQRWSLTAVYQESALFLLQQACFFRHVQTVSRKRSRRTAVNKTI